MLRNDVKNMTIKIKKATPVSHRYDFKRIYGIIIRKKDEIYPYTHIYTNSSTIYISLTKSSTISSRFSQASSGVSP